jgi:hypothetical protein
MAEEYELLGDKFNKAALEEKIQELSPLVPVSNDGYCPSCQKLLHEWPDIIKKVPEIFYSTKTLPAAAFQKHARA